MGFDDLCNTGLGLGLGLTASSSTKKPSTTSTITTTSFEPSLTLGLSGDPYSSNSSARKININIDVNKGGSTSTACHHEEAINTNNSNNNNNIDLYRQASPHSAVSSFSGGGRVKRERDLSSEEIEVEKVSSRISDEDEDGPNARKKLRLTKEQSALLEESFKQHSTLNPVIFFFSLSLYIYINICIYTYILTEYILCVLTEAKASFSQTVKSAA